VNDHPGRAELVSQHAEAMGEEGFLEGHEDLPPVGEKVVDAFRFRDAVDREGKIDTAHGLEAIGRNIVGHDIGLAQGHAGVHDFGFPVVGDLRGRASGWGVVVR
jgi:hypothetical protein